MQPHGDRYQDIINLRQSLISEMKSCYIAALCQSLQARVEGTDWSGLLNEQERIADAIRMTYYTMKGLSIPNDVKYRVVIYPDVTGRVNTLLSSLETQYAGAKNLRIRQKVSSLL